MAQEYIWPTDASKYLTSTFAEFRPGHFHAGIDIKTWGKEGYKVVAIRDGYVWQIKVSPYGYGKVLYQRLDTGETVVYAHLQKFNEQIEKIVKNEQQKKGEYRITKQFGSEVIPVKQGDLIAYTGSTGIGEPHLHFEIRDQGNRPINPFLLGYKVTDTIPPGISNFSITPLDANSRVNSDVKPIIIKPLRVRTGEYAIKEKVLLSGNIGFAVDCYDQANDVKNVYAAYRLDFFIEDVLKFSAVYNTFSYDVNNLIYLDRDYRLKSRGYGKFQRLYHEFESGLSFYRPPGKKIGIIYCDSSESKITDNGIVYSQGTHNFLIEIYDFNGNKTSLKGKFSVGKKRQIFSEVKIDEDETFCLSDIFDMDGNSITNTKFYLSPNQGKSWIKYRLSQYPKVEKLYNKSPNPKYQIETGNPIEILKITAEDGNGIAAFPFYSLLIKEIPLPDPEVDFRIEQEFYDDYIRLKLFFDGLIKDSPKLYVQQIGNRPIDVELVQTDFNSYLGVYELIPGGDGPVDIEVYAQNLSGKELIFWDQFDVRTITPQTGGKIVSKDNKCRVSFGPNSVFENLFLRINETTVRDTNKHEFVGAAYNIKPHDVALKKGAMVHLKYPADDPKPKKLGVYGSYSRKWWSFAGGRLNKENSTISARISGLRFVTLVRDTIPPEIKIYSPANGSYIKSRYPTLKAWTKDRLSRIANERSIVMKLDGKKVIAEFDPEDRTTTYKVEEPLAPGKHEVTVWAIDNSGNKSFLRHTFTVVGNRK